MKPDSKVVAAASASCQGSVIELKNVWRRGDAVLCERADVSGVVSAPVRLCFYQPIALILYTIRITSVATDVQIEAI